VNIDCLPFSSLPFSKIFNSYLQSEPSIKSFFETDPQNAAEVQSFLKSFKFSGERSDIVSWLTDFHTGFNAPPETKESIKKLESPDSLVIVTGQQCTIFGGPLFTVYKIITAITKARKWEEMLKRPVVPVFWIADEDHDFEEAVHIAVQTGEQCTKLEYGDRSERGRRVSEISFSDEILRIKEELKSQMYETDFSDDLWNMLDSVYKPGNTFGEAFGQIVLNLFGKHGLILAGSNTKKSKELAADTMATSVSGYQPQYDALSSQSEKLKNAGYKNQVYLNPSNLFFIDENQDRKKIQIEDNHWIVPESGISWTTDELADVIGNMPEKFSPNVFLRPLIQDKLLPVASYVAGPGEVAYYAQMKTFYHQFGMQMPIITPRYSATLVESGIERIIQKLPFTIPDYSKRIEDLESDFIDQIDTPDVEKLFGMWQNQVKEDSKHHVNHISDIDPTLKKSAEKSISIFFNELDRLKGKVYKSLKDSEETQINRIEKIKQNLFPNRNLQEREIAFIYFMNKYGVDIWGKLLDELTDEKPDCHKIIYL